MSWSNSVGGGGHTHRWELAHERGRDDLDNTESANHVCCNCAVRGCSHVACADLWWVSGKRRLANNLRTLSCTFLRTVATTRST